MYDLSDIMAEKYGKGLGKDVPTTRTGDQTEPKAGPESGIRNEYAYRQTMSNVKDATQAAIDGAGTPEMRSSIAEIANARTITEKKQLLNKLLADNPAEADFINKQVGPLTEFGPKDSPSGGPKMMSGIDPMDVKTKLIDPLIGAVKNALTGDGKPSKTMKVYHGTSQTAADAITKEGFKLSTDDAFDLPGVSVTEDESLATLYAGEGPDATVMPLTLEGDPKDYIALDAAQKLFDREADAPYSDAAFLKFLKDKGIKGLRHTNQDGESEIRVLDPKYIKVDTEAAASRALFSGDLVPGEGVTPGNTIGIAAKYRVKIDRPVDIVVKAPKGVMTLKTNIKNAVKNLEGVDFILKRFPNATRSAKEWATMIGSAFGTDEPEVPPFGLIKHINDPKHDIKLLNSLTKGQLADADHGFEQARAFRKAYKDGRAGVRTTASMFLWSFLSRGVSPFVQEGMFIDSVEGAYPFIDKAVKEGRFDADEQVDLGDGKRMSWNDWAATVSPKGSGQPGNGTQHNLNAFGHTFLKKMAEIAPGTNKSGLQHLHDMIASDMTGPEIRREFLKSFEGVGIDMKVLSFSLLVTGRSDVMVLDRVQVRRNWNDGRFGDENLYDTDKWSGVKHPDGTVEKFRPEEFGDPDSEEASKAAAAAAKKRAKEVGGKEFKHQVSGSSLSTITYGARGLLVYEAMERGLTDHVNKVYKAVGREKDASIGRYHWETWVGDAGQEASHGSLGGILNSAEGKSNPFAESFAKEGQYDTYNYGAEYSRGSDNTPKVRYPLPTGETVVMTIPDFTAFKKEVSNAKSGVVPKGFKVSDATSEPWYLNKAVDKARLRELAYKFSKR